MRAPAQHQRREALQAIGCLPRGNSHSEKRRGPTHGQPWTLCDRNRLELEAEYEPHRAGTLEKVGLSVEVIHDLLLGVGHTNVVPPS